MEANRKRSRGFLKGKLMVSFNRAPQPSSTVQYNTTTTTTTTTKVKPNPPSPSPASVGYVVHQDYVIAQPKPNVSFVVAERRGNFVRHVDELYGVPGDESVDTKAALYITMIQERLALERENPDAAKIQDK